MDYYLILSLGMLAQVLFAARFIVQLTKSELAGRVVSPTLFWQLSLLASLLLVIYGFLRNDIVIIGGQAVTYYIYIRNLQLKKQWQQFHIAFRYGFLMLPAILLISLLVFAFKSINGLLYNPDIPLLLLTYGTIGQAVFTLRFVIQWIHSEKKKESEFPVTFWIISLLGALMIIGYAIMRKDAVLFVGQFFGTLVYSRNLFLHYAEKRIMQKQSLSVAVLLKKHKLLLLSALVTVVLLFNLNDWSVTESTEARYAQVSKEMFESGDYLHPTLMGIKHYHKPPLTYWVTCAAYAVFGVNSFAARFFLQIGVVLQMLIVFGIAKLLLRCNKQAFLTAILYFALPGVYMSTRALTTDVYLTTFVLLAIFAWFKFVIEKRKLFLLLFYVSLGLGFFTKGPVVFIFPFFVLTGAYFGGYKPPKQVAMHFLGVMLMLMIGLWWFIYLYVMDDRFLDYFLIRHTIERVTTDVFKRSEPWWFYLALVPAASFPWLIAFFSQVFRSKQFKSTNGIITLAWLVPPLLFFSLSQSKLMLYVLPVYAGIAIGSVWMWMKMTRLQHKSWGRVQFAFHCVVLTAFALAPLIITDLVLSPYAYLFLLLTAVFLVSLMIIPVKTHEKPILAAAVFMYGLALIIPYIFEHNPERVKDSQYIVQFIDEKLPETENILVFDRRLASIPFHTDRNVISLYAGNHTLDREVQFETDDLWKENLKNLLDNPELFPTLIRPGNVLLVRSRRGLPDTFADDAAMFDHKTTIDGWDVYYFDLS